MAAYSGSYRSGGGFGSVVLVTMALMAIGVGIAFVCGVSRHVDETGHTGEQYPSRVIFQELESVSLDPSNKPKICPAGLVIASCPYAVNWDTDSPNYGKPSPQVRVWCGKTDTFGIYGTFGLNFNKDAFTFITGYGVSKAKFDSLVARDKCDIKEQKYFNVLFR